MHRLVWEEQYELLLDLVFLTFYRNSKISGVTFRKENSSVGGPGSQEQLEPGACAVSAAE